MPEPKEIQESPKSNETPLVFISHDSRDADLAEAFSKLLKSVSAGMLKSFRSSDKKGTEGIAFGDEWYNTLMSKLDSASDVVCLLTERSLDRPWLLYETGVAKGKLGTPVQGIALGVPLSRVSPRPFFIIFIIATMPKIRSQSLYSNYVAESPILIPIKGLSWGR